MNNKLIVASAGSGKTTFIVKEALKQKSSVLITTFTEANEAEIKKKIIQLNKFIPVNITVKTWFSFLIQHGVKPYQGSFFEERVRGFILVSQSSAQYIPEANIKKHFFSDDNKIFSDKVSKFVVRCNEKSNGNVFTRLSHVFQNIYIDEVQDLAGWDLDILKLLFQSSSNILLVGDPRQVTYLTHPDKKYSPYKKGKIEDFILKECKGLNCEIDKVTLNVSHRNNADICSFSSLLYPLFPISIPCNCVECRSFNTNHSGIFIVKKTQVENYIQFYSPTILKYKEAREDQWNFGKSKGLGFARVLIYPTKDFEKFLRTGNLTKTVKSEVKDAFDIAKFYVALTRAYYSVGIISDYTDDEIFINSIQKLPEVLLA